MEKIKNWSFGEGELAYFLEELNISKGKLSLLKDYAEVPKTPTQSFSKEDTELIKAFLKVLADPTRVVELFINRGDFLYQTLALGEHKDHPGFYVGISREGLKLIPLVFSLGELNYVVLNYLGGDKISPQSAMAVNLSTKSAITFLATLDQYKRSHMISMLNYLSPMDLFNKADLEDILNSSHQSDFRWLITLLDKIMPIRVNSISWQEDLDASIAELQSLELIDSVNDEDSAYELSPITKLLAEGYRNSLSTVFVGHTTSFEDKLVHDILGFVGGAFGILGVMMSGSESSIATLDGMSVITILDNLLGQAHVGESIDESMESPIEEPIINPPLTSEEAFVPVAPSTNLQSPTAENHWTCSCGVQNKGNFCVSCGSPKPAPNTNWQCSCGAISKGMFCPQCGLRKP